MNAQTPIVAAETAEDHRAALRTAREYCNNLCSTAMTTAAYGYATDARGVAERYMNAEVPAPRLKIARDLARNLVMAAFLSDHLERLDSVGEE